MKDQIHEVINKAIHGDKSAFREIVDVYSQRVYNIAYQIIGDSVEAQDVTQDVFIRLYQSLKKYDSQFKFTTWLYRITVNISIDHHRKNTRYRFISLDKIKNKSEFENDCSQTKPHIERHELKGVIKKLSKKLTSNQQKVFVLRDLQGFPTDEVAKILNCNPVTVRVHLANARQRIKQALIRDYPELCDRKNLEE